MSRTGSAAVVFFCGVVLAGACSAADARSYRSLHAFPGGTEGANPEAGLVAVGGSLYGTTYGGGSARCGGCGTVFSVDAATGAAAVVHAFRGGASGAYPAAGLLAVGGRLYGATFGGNGTGNSTIFVVHPSKGTVSTAYRFPSGGTTDPDSTLLDVGGTLFGTTMSGGQGGGTVFAFDLKARTGSVAYTFQGAPDGSKPRGGFLAVGGLLYGTTYGGGAGGQGTVYTIDPTSGATATVYAFAGSADGSGPIGELIAVGGTLYGTTEYGGPAGLGTVFSLDLATGKEAVVHAFAGGDDGAMPAAGLVALGTTLYGTTANGGPSGDGAVFALDPATGADTILHAFTGGSDGAHPSAPLSPMGGTLYGTTKYGGDAANCPGNSGFFVGCGTVFAVMP